MKEDLGFYFVADIIDGYPRDKQPLVNKSSTLKNTPQYRVEYPRFLADFELAEALRTLEQTGDIDPERLDEIIGKMRARLLAMHPTLPILTGLVPLLNPKRQIPVSFKLGKPGLKQLNSWYDPSGADAFMEEVHGLVEQFFGATEGGLPVLSLVSRDAKGGKALFNLDAAEFAGKAKEDAFNTFNTKVAVFQVRLGQLLKDFDASHGNKLPADLKAQMQFGGIEAWDLAQESAKIETKDLVLHFIQSEYIANLTRLRFQYDRREPQRANPGRRRSAAFLPARRTMGILEIELRKTVPAFKDLFTEHLEDPQWMGDEDHPALFTAVDTEGTYFLSLYTLQCYRKGVLREAFPFLSEKDEAVIRNVIEVINTVDVLKPFVEEDIDIFCERLNSIASLLKEDPEESDKKKMFALALARELRVSLKNKMLGADPVGHTRFAVSEQLYKVLCTGDVKEPYTLALGDVAAFGAANLFVLFGDLFNFYAQFPSDDQHDIIESWVRTLDKQQLDEKLPQLLPALKKLLCSAGDEVTTIKRNIDRRFKELISGLIANVEGGDEVEGIYPSSSSSGMGAFLPGTNLRMVTAQLPTDANLDLQQGAELASSIYVFANGLMRAIKVAEESNKQISEKPVNISIMH